MLGSPAEVFGRRFEAQMIQGIWEQRVVLAEKGERDTETTSDRAFSRIKAEVLALHPDGVWTLRVPLPTEELIQGLRLHAYPDFGYYVYKSDDFFLGVRCGEVGQLGFGGHAHNDQLSVELNVGGRDILADPGAYLYTPFPDIRNLYRSVQAHFAPRIGDIEPIRLDQGLFRLRGSLDARCLCFSRRGFVGSFQYDGTEIYRIVEFDREAVVISDVCARFTESEVTELASLEELERFSSLPFSPGYGEILRDG